MVLIGSLCVIGCAPEAAPPTEEEEAPPPEEEEEAPPPATPEEQVYHLGLQDIGPAASSNFKNLDKFAKNVREASGGRIDITVYPEGEITPRHETTVGVRDGAVDMADNNATMDLGRMGNTTYLLGGTGLPAGPSTDELTAWVYSGGGLEIMRDWYKDWGYVIGIAPGATELFCHSNEIFDDAEDFKGIRFRTMGLWAEILTSYGASVVDTPGGEVYQALERGVIDAFELGPPSYNWPLGFQEIAKYIGVPGIQSPGYFTVVLMNNDRYNELPGDLQKLLEDECMNMSVFGQHDLKMADAEAMKNYREYGTEIFTLTDEFQAQLAKDSREMIEAFAAEDPDVRKVWEHQLEFFNMWRGLTNIFPKYTIFD